MTKVLIIEDKKESRDLLVRMVQEIDDNAVVYAVENEDKAYPIAMKKSVDVFLVDIILHPERTGDQSGAVFAQNMRNIERYFFTPIIFITTLYDTKMCMFSTVQCFGFVEKPFDIEKTKKMIAKAMRYHTNETEERSYFFHTEGLLGSVLVNDIIFIESRNHKLYMRTTKEEVIIPYKSCNKMLEELDSDDFEKCSRSTIVNMRYIERIDSPGRYIYLKGIKEALEIGPVMKKHFLERFFGRD